MTIVFLGLSITSSWGNGHATTYRSLVRALAAAGHRVSFLERDVPWYAANRDLAAPPYCDVHLYTGIGELDARSGTLIREADLVVVGSYVPEGQQAADYVLRTAHGCTAFYDIDTPITLAALERDAAEYIDRRQARAFDLYLSFTGGPTLERLEQEFAVRRARPLYCSVDPDLYHPEPGAGSRGDLGYLGTYSADRQPALDALLIGPAVRWPRGRFAVAGPMYPDTIAWPPNVERVIHLAPAGHRGFYNAYRFTLNVTRRDMIAAGYSPSVRLFEAAACGTAIISDAWPGLETFFEPGREILLAAGGADVLAWLQEMPDEERRDVGARARARVLDRHTAAHRVRELEGYVSEAGAGRAADARTGSPRPMAAAEAGTA